jgi:hypothetical protein
MSSVARKEKYGVLHLDDIYFRSCIIVDIIFINLYFMIINNKRVCSE